ncbi:MAG: quinoprotein dehydrogenase-associated putative ABC transporter substrate-binding protein, partial [Gammaproteobacteria bacterium]|nr:quinoprotein dehydrogenase-associated putative ABC transporter substrate-binding protein [Gammaproteobacteria bacterium]
PFNLPMSNREQAGYENRIASLFADKLGLPLEYEWFPQRIGFIRNTLRNNETEDGSYKCDLVMGVIDNFELAATTIPYMRSTWAMVYIKGRGVDWIESVDSLRQASPEQVETLNIGIWDKGPATDWIFKYGLMEQATPYQIMPGDARVTPGTIIEKDLVQDKVNVVFVWGPIAGYYAKTITDHEVVVLPMKSEAGIRFDFQIAMAVRFGEKKWKDTVNTLIRENQDGINSILDEFETPRLEIEYPEADDDDDDD